MKKYELVRAWGYYGGKAKMVDKILSCLPAEYTSWHEMFIGGGSITFSKNKPASCLSEVINDYDRTIANFYLVLADKRMAKCLMEELIYRGMNKAAFMRAKEYIVYNSNKMNDIELAVSTYCEIAQSYSAMRKNYAGGRNEKAYINTIEKQLPKVIDRLISGIIIKNEDAIELLTEVKNDEGAMVYLDPPYRMGLRNGKGYRCELDVFQQVRLLRALQKCKCKILLSGYREEYGTDLYDSYLLPYGFKVYRLCEATKSCQSKNKKDKAVEYIWCNYELPSGAMIQDEVIPVYKYVKYDELSDDRIYKKVG